MKRRLPSSAPRREIAVYYGRDCVGRIQVAVNGEARAFNSSGDVLGLFPTETAALAALSTVERELERRA
jgi:hypothetical protein